MEDYISRQEHDTFCQLMKSENERLKDEDRRQNHRIDELEENVKAFNAIANSVDKLATNMNNMLKELERQGKRLETLEGKDGEMWRKVVGYVITAIIGIVVGFVFKQIGM